MNLLEKIIDTFDGVIIEDNQWTVNGSKGKRYVILIDESVDTLQKLVNHFGISLGAVLVSERLGSGLQTRVFEFESHPALNN